MSNLTQPHREEQKLASPLTHKPNGSYRAPGCCWGLSRDEATVPHLVPWQGALETTCQQKAGSGDVSGAAEEMQAHAQEGTRGPWKAAL